MDVISHSESFIMFFCLTNKIYMKVCTYMV